MNTDASPGPVFTAIIQQVRGSKIIMEALPHEIARLGIVDGDSVAAAKAMLSNPFPLGPLSYDPRYTLYNASGVPVAMLRSYGCDSTPIDVTTHGDPNPRYILGVPRIRAMEVSPLPGATHWLTR